MSLANLHELEHQAAFLGTVRAVELLFTRSPIVADVRRDLDAGTISLESAIRFGRDLIEARVPNEHLPHEIALCALLYLLEGSASSTAKEFVAEVGAMRAPEFALAISLAREFLQRRTIKLVTSRATVTYELAQTIVTSGQIYRVRGTDVPTSNELSERPVLRLEYFLASDTVAVDRDTNLVSIQNVLEEIMGRGPGVLPRIAAIACFIVDPEGVGTEFEARLRVFGGVPREQVFAVRGRPGGRRWKVLFRLEGVEVTGSSDINFEITCDGQTATHCLSVIERGPPTAPEA